MARGRQNSFDLLAKIFWGATGLTCCCYLLLFILPPIPGIAVPTPVRVAQIPTMTASPTGPTPTLPPTLTPTPRPTNTPVIVGSPTPSGATETPRPTNTRIASRTPTPTWGPSVTASPTRSKYPFTADIYPQLSPYGCTWSGILGAVYDLEGKPLIGYTVHVEGDADIDRMLTSGSSQFAKVPGFGESAWDVPINASGFAKGTWRVRLYKPGTNTPLSELYEVKLERNCGGSTLFVKFVQNH